jgi:hypothetical protein
MAKKENNATNIKENPEKHVKLEYYINNQRKKEGILEFGSKNFINDRISYENITYSFYLFIKYNSSEFFDKKIYNIRYEFIRYFDGEGWILLKEKEVIFIDDDLTFSKLKIMIKANIITNEKLDVETQYDEIDKKINYIYNEMLKVINNKYSSPPDAPLNLVVLTANPLMNGEKELLRTMNDFNIITSKIYDLFSKEYYLKYTEFSPLTKEILKEIISNEDKRPVILHLIFKSIYLKSENDDDDCVKLIFEKDYNSRNEINNYNLEFIDKNILKNEIFNFNENPKIKDNIGKITLIISTPLAEDVFDIFKDFGFKNIIIQHTTLADVNFIANFNMNFYNIMITYLSQPINTIYKQALYKAIVMISLMKKILLHFVVVCISIKKIVLSFKI